MKKILVSAAALLAAAIGTSAFAAEANFSGPYAGVNAAYVLGSTNIDDYDCDLTCSSLSLSPVGGAIGVTGGYNHQVGSLVLGVEGDYNFASAKKNLSYEWGQDYAHHDTRINAYGTIRGRAGIVADKALLFVTGGLGVIDQDTIGYNPNSSQPDDTNRYAFADHATKVGVAFGTGVEYKLSDKVSAKVEYLSIKTATRNAIKDTGTQCNGNSYCAYAVKNGLDTVRVGVNYAF